VRVITAPGGTRDFLGFVYSYRPLPYQTAIRAAPLEEILLGIDRLPVQVRKCFPKHGNMTGDEIIAVCLLVLWAGPK